MGVQKSSRHGQGRERKSSFFSIFNVLKSGEGRKSGDGEDMWDEAVQMRRVRHSDEDRDQWVAEPDIDRKASAFIARFYQSRVTDSDLQTVSPYDLVNGTHQY